MSSGRRSWLAAVLVAVLAGCGGGGGGTQVLPQVQFEVSTYSAASNAMVPNTFVVELDSVRAPITTANFLAYVARGYYDNTVFHRVISTFVIQGGGFEIVNNQYTPKAPAPGLNPIVLERTSQTGLSNVAGTIAMARTGAADSATSQFFINVVDNNLRLDQPNAPDGQGYAVFGRVIADTGGVEAIRNARVTTPDFPDFPQLIVRATRIR